MGFKAPHVLVKRVDEDPEGQVALEFRRRSREHETVMLLRAGCELGEEASSSSGLAHELHGRPRSTTELGECVIEGFELVSTPNEMFGEQHRAPFRHLRIIACDAWSPM